VASFLPPWNHWASTEYDLEQQSRNQNQKLFTTKEERSGVKDTKEFSF
jgi:hypothetical protein